MRFPRAHWAQRWLCRSCSWGFETEAGASIGGAQHSPSKACPHFGTIPLILAATGFVAGRDARLDLWKRLVPLSFVLATMPQWWLEGYVLLLKLPILGYFRAPARYTLLTQLGLALLAGRGFDRLLPTQRFWAGYGLAAAFGGAALAFSAWWSLQLPVLAELRRGSASAVDRLGLRVVDRRAGDRGGMAAPEDPTLGAADRHRGGAGLSLPPRDDALGPGCQAPRR